MLTNDGGLQARIADPKHKLAKTYWVQVEGEPSDEQLQRLRDGVELNDGPTLGRGAAPGRARVGRATRRCVFAERADQLAGAGDS